MTPSQTPPGPTTPRAALVLGLRESIGLPVAVLAASFLGFGSLVAKTDLPLWLGLASTLTGWALPGQVALVEMAAVGSSVLVIALAVGMVNARLLPMTITLMPLLRAPGTRPWGLYAASHLIAVTSWIGLMQRGHRVPHALRLSYFFGFSLPLWAMSLVATAVGFHLAGAVPSAVSLGLVFLNPLYFLLVMCVDLRRRALLLSLMFGAVLGPLLHLLSPDWGLPATGLVGGTLAWLLARRGPPRDAPGHG